MPQGFDFGQEAIGMTNELFYRNGPQPESLGTNDALLVRETIERGLRQAFAAGIRVGQAKE